MMNPFLCDDDEDDDDDDDDIWCTLVYHTNDLIQIIPFNRILFDHFIIKPITHTNRTFTVVCGSSLPMSVNCLTSVVEKALVETESVRTDSLKYRYIIDSLLSMIKHMLFVANVYHPISLI